MIHYTVDGLSKLDTNLTKAWEKWDKYKNDIPNWLQFLKTLPGVEVARYDENEFISHLIFADKPSLSMFLLRWS